MTAFHARPATPPVTRTTALPFRPGASAFRAAAPTTEES